MTSATAARDSADIAVRSEARQTERNDVAWQCELDHGVWTITNTGVDAAQDVVAIVSVDSERFVEEATAVPGKGGTLEVDFMKKWELSDAALRRLLGGVKFKNPRPHEPTIATRVHWKAPAGAPKSYEAEPLRVSLDGAADLRELRIQMREFGL